MDKNLGISCLNLLQTYVGSYLHLTLICWEAVRSLVTFKVASI